MLVVYSIETLATSVLEHHLGFASECMKINEDKNITKSVADEMVTLCT